MGSISLYLEDGADSDTAMYETRKAIRSLMSQTGPLRIPKVTSIEYLSPDLSGPSAAEASGAGTNSLQSGGDGSSPTITVLAAVGGLFVVVAVFAAYRIRKNKADSRSTFGAETLSGDSSAVAGGNSPRSPRLVLPGAYQLNEAHGINTIMENSDIVGHSGDDTDIMVSECGYTDDQSSRDHSCVSSGFHDEMSILGPNASSYDEYDNDKLLEAEHTPRSASSTVVSHVSFGEQES
jgi:hypothetical protein